MHAWFVRPGAARRGRRSERVVALFAGADADRLLDGHDEDLAVADLAGLGGVDDRLDGARRPARRPAPPRSSPSAGSRRRIRRRGRVRCDPSAVRSPWPRSR